MKEKIYDARTGMEYVLVGDYYLPALKLPRTRPIGRWGMLHKAYLKLRKPAYYQSLLLSGKLDTVLANVEEQAVERYEVLIEQLSQREVVSEKLKEENQMEWVRRMRNLENRAEEIVKAELIYTFEGRVEGYIMARPELAKEPLQEYVDDGYSGTSTSRPAFQRLIQDAQDGKLKTIIVKDFSRFARDYIEAGDYMERIFPLLGVRFISVNDGYDSGMQIRNDICGLEVAIKNIINASYSRDLSAKIAAADHVMQKKGMYLGGYRPFGFLPDPNDCHKLILDPVASQYVRLIFELALQGNRTGTIAKILNEKQIPTPAAYHVAESYVYSEQKAWDLQRSHWTSGTV